MARENGYRAIYTVLRKRITDGVYAAGSMLPPERVLREEWGVERTTLRRALALLAEEGLIVKRAGLGSIVVDSAAEEEKNDASAGHTAAQENAAEEDVPVLTLIAATKGKTVDEHYFISPVYSAFAAAAAENGYSPISLGTYEKTFSPAMNAVLRNSRGTVWADNVSEEILQTARARGIPSVLMSQRMSGFRSVLCDNLDGMEQAVDHLVRLGHRNIAFVGGETVYCNAVERLDGFRLAMMRRGLSVPEKNILLCGWRPDSVIEPARKLLLESPEITAICTVNNGCALGVLTAAESLHIRVPESLSVVGFCAVESMEGAERSLTTVYFPTKAFGHELFRALEWEIAHPYEEAATVLISAGLRVGSTSAAPTLPR